MVECLHVTSALHVLYKSVGFVFLFFFGKIVCFSFVFVVVVF